MPVEIHQIHLRPADFFTANPAIDVPGTKNHSSLLVSDIESCCESGVIQHHPVSHLQGTDPDSNLKPKL
jgi:primary-amine oxidase